MPVSTAKPLDVGTGVVAASFAEDGSWLSIGCLHPRWGFVELNGLPLFLESDRGDPAATRRHRARMTSPEYAWLRVETANRTQAPAGSIGAAGAPGSSWITQRRVSEDGTGLVIRVAGRLDRPALAEITEVNPPAPTGARTALRVEGARLYIEAAALPAVITVEVSDGAWVLADAGAELRLDGARTLDISVTIGPGLEPPVTPPEPWEPPPARADGIDRIVERALAYVRSCSALAFAPGERAILTDHRLLPLSWTRDAYYQALLLLAGGAPGDAAIVADHLRWTWRRCRRADGRWMRSHHGNGEPKDLAFQADQQLYPFVELAAFWRATGGLPDGVAWDEVVPAAWRAVLGAIDPVIGLVPTEENAADDRIEAPFSAGSQVLLWYTATRLAEAGLASAVGLESRPLLATAAGVRAAFERLIVHEGRWAYAVDDRRRTVDYHDANEFPIALAPVWGFCPRDDRAWLATMEYAFSPANPGFVDGPGGGLGSRHTPGVWPLGLVQAWLVARIRDDAAGAAAALEQLEDAAFDDGMLPESIVRDGGTAVRVRHWFAWPGAALGALWLLDRDGRLDSIRARRGPRTARAAPG
jgi:hypothetical protein